MRVNRYVYLVGDGGRGLSHDLDCCVYLVDCGSSYLMIDSGVGLDSGLIVNNIRADGVPLDKVRHLVLTHSHSDHACGARYFQKELQLEVIAPIKEAEIISQGSDEELGLDVARGAIYPPDFAYKHCKPDRVVSDGEEIKIGDKVATFIQVPGHSPGIVCVFFRNEKILFSSDVVFHGGTIGLGNWKGCDLSEYRSNIGKLSGLGVEQLFPGHFLFVLRNGQKHIDTAVNNLKGPWIPPAWLHRHPHL
ncbi:MAG: MBL fold metallo-hydrolase [Nitrososphaerota archaeon]